MRSGKKGQIALLILFFAVPISWIGPTPLIKAIICILLVIGSGILACIDMEEQRSCDKRNPNEIVGGFRGN